MAPRPRTLGLALAAAALVLVLPVAASANYSRTRSCEKTSSTGKVMDERATASVEITEGNRTINRFIDVTPSGMLTITVAASGTGIPSTFTATLNGRSTSGSAPGSAQLAAPMDAGGYTMAIVVTAGANCDLTLRIDAPINVGRASEESDPNQDQSDLSDAGEDVDPPTVVVRKVKARRGRSMHVFYRVSGETDATDDVIDIRDDIDGESIDSTEITSAKTGWRRVRFVLPLTARRGKYVVCVTSLDASGNESEVTCARLTLR